MQAYFQIGGLVIVAADNGVGELAGCSLLGFDVKNPVAFPDSKLWLSLTEGDMLITLDAPFVLHLPESYDGLVKHDWQLPCGGVKVAYVLQYQLGEPNGMDIQKGGTVPWMEACARTWQTSALRLLACRQGAFTLQGPRKIVHCLD